MAEGAPKGQDWCHVCGERPKQLADIWYPKNAEHQRKNMQYIRICADCADLIGRIARGQARDQANDKGMVVWGRYKG